MPVRHFLRRDYLHILFYIKFLLFVSLVYQIRIFKGILQYLTVVFSDIPSEVHDTPP